MSKQNISDRELYDAFMSRFGKKATEGVAIEGVWDIEVTRADGTVEKRRARNTLTSAGLNKLAQLGITNGTNSAFLYLAVGTQTAASSLGSVQGGMGEVIRKLGSTQTTSKEFMILVCTMAGAADSITSLDLRTASAVNHASSGSGEHLNFVNSVATILADSDFLKLQMNIRVGSHNL